MESFLNEGVMEIYIVIHFLEYLWRNKFHTLCL